MNGRDPTQPSTMKAIETLNPPIENAKPAMASGSSRLFNWVASISAAIGIGAAVACLQSLRWDSAAMTFQITMGSWAAFALGAAGGMLLWWAAASGHRSARYSAWAAAVAGLVMLLYPLRYVSPGKLREFTVGGGTAVVAVTIGAFLLWKVKQGLDSDEQSAEDPRAQSAKAKPLERPRAED